MGLFTIIEILWLVAYGSSYTYYMNFGGENIYYKSVLLRATLATVNQFF